MLGSSTNRLYGSRNGNSISFGRRLTEGEVAGSAEPSSLSAVYRPEAGDIAASMSDLRTRISKRRSVRDIFKSSCKFLDQFLPLKRASLALYDAARDKFVISTVRSGHGYGSGVKFELAAANSILSSVNQETGAFVLKPPYPIDLPFMDSKVILGEDTGAVALIPLRNGKGLIGTFNLGTEAALDLEQYRSNLFVRFATELTRRLEEVTTMPAQA
jgi:hypothetical protein